MTLRPGSGLADQPIEAGPHSMSFDGRDEAGGTLAPGVCLARLETPGFTARHRGVVLE